MIKIGITGSKGLLGILLKKIKKKRIKFSEFRGDISKKSNVSKWMSSNKDIEYIFHFAAVSSPKKARENQDRAKKINILGTNNLIIEANKRKKYGFFSKHCTCV